MQIKVRVITNAKKERIVKIREHLSRLPAETFGKEGASKTTRENIYQYKIYVSVSPIEGRANQKVTELLANFFKVKKSQITIVSGLKSKEKVINIED